MGGLGCAGCEHNPAELRRALVLAGGGAHGAAALSSPAKYTMEGLRKRMEQVPGVCASGACLKVREKE